MAYGTKYTNIFSVKEGPTRVFSEYVLYIKKDGYTGEITNLPDLGGSGIVAKINNSQDKYKGIQDKKLSIDILTNLNLSELLDAQPKQWRVELAKRVPIDGGDYDEINDFVGFLQPSKNSTPYEDGRINYKLEACDGLEFLKNTDFIDSNNIYYEGIVSVFEIIRLCLSKIGTGLGINTINNIFGTGDDISASAESLKQRFIDLDLFRGDSEPLDTYKVLSSVLETEKMRIFQEGAEWWIEYVPEKISGTVRRRKYDAAGTISSWGNLNLDASAVHNSPYYQPTSGGSLSNLTPIKYAKVTHKLGKWKNNLLNPDLRQWDGTNFTNWQATPGTTFTRVGAGTSGDPYGIRISGFFTKNINNAKGVFQRVIIFNTGDDLGNLEKNIVFKGQAFTRDVEYAYVSCYLLIETFAYGNFPFGLTEDGDWSARGASIGLRNSDVNGKSKKTPVSWDITSKNIAEINVQNQQTGVVVPWKTDLKKVTIQFDLAQGKNQLDPYPGETQDSHTIFNNLSLGWINANTNLNLKEIYYKATQTAYSPNNDESEVIYGDYADGGNLSSIKNASGQPRKTWESISDITGRNFHALHAADILTMQSKTQKVYDGTIWGLLKYRHIVTLAGFTNRGYIVGYSYNYCTSVADVRIVEYQNAPTIQRKKVGVLSDSTEISLIDETLPGPRKGIGGLIDYLVNLAKSIKNGMAVTNDDDETGLLIWDKIEDGQVHDMSTLVRQNNNLRIGKDDENLEVGKSTGLIKMLGGLSLGNLGGFFTSIVTTATTARQVTMPDRDIVINDWDYIVGAPDVYPPDASFFFTDYGVVGVQNGINKVFQTSHNFVSGSTQVFLNGLRQFKGSDKHYTETGSNEITFIEAPVSDDDIIIDYIKDI